MKEVERHPPSYAYCISHGPTVVCSSDELPSYEEAVRRSSVQKPCCSKTLLPRSDPPLPSCSTSNDKPAAEAQSESRTQASGKTKAQLKAQVQRYLKTTAPSDAASQPRRQRIVAIQIEHPPSNQVEQRSVDVLKYKDRTLFLVRNCFFDDSF
ncbi:hypothetical protein OESDEN_13883 [Oesophagostomum dentatum]|uniref:Uncharacterized protein n=1 Tax=Oesophagostomum dentatum TaxID=61180 RepID=A0A0B1SR41_OESDE|nr:hypothetical protein OESDEN_13883 [Oesophagostomum dentatum]